MIIDCISDLHGFYPAMEGGDLLIVAGDLTARNYIVEHHRFVEWLCSQTYKRKIFIAGNHDSYWVFRSLYWKDDNTEYLCDSATEFEGLNIWGSPWTKTFSGMNPHCKAFTVDTEEELADKWKLIPHNIDILITHSPPYDILDKTIDGRNTGSSSLWSWFKYVERPKLHVFGHIHEAYGQEEKFMGYNDIMVKSINASHVNERYEPVNKPIRVIL